LAPVGIVADDLYTCSKIVNGRRVCNRVLVGPSDAIDGPVDSAFNTTTPFKLVDKLSSLA